MAGALFGYQRMTAGTLSGGDWRAALPLANAIVEDVGVVARSVDASTDATQFVRDYGAAVTLRLFALVRTNLSVDATWEIIASNNPDLSAPVWTSGSLAAWPEQWPTGLLDASHLNAGTRKLTAAQLAARQWDVLHLAAADHTARYWGVAITDTTNPDGFVDLGFVVMVPIYQPGNDDNVGAGATFGTVSTTQVGEAMGGTRLVNRQRHARTHTLAFPALAHDEAVAVLRDMLDELGQDRFVYFVMDPDAAELLQRTSYLAQVEQLPEVQLVAYGQQVVPVKLREVL